MATAWQQAGALSETNRAIGNALLRRAVGSTWKKKSDKLDPQQKMSVLWPQMSFARTKDGNPVKSQIYDSTVPNGALRNVMQRHLRPSGVVMRSFKAPLKRANLPGRENPYIYRTQAAAWLRNSLDSPVNREKLKIAEPAIPGGTRTPDPRREQAKTGVLPAPATPRSNTCLLYTSPSPRDATLSRMPSSA